MSASFDDSRFDIIIVGGGLAGASAALHAAEARLRVLLLEANTLASGASARNGGIMWPSDAFERAGVVEMRARFPAAFQFPAGGNGGTKAMAAATAASGAACRAAAKAPLCC